jgi:hypothetical protein
VVAPLTPTAHRVPTVPAVGPPIAPTMAAATAATAATAAAAVIVGRGATRHRPCQGACSCWCCSCCRGRRQRQGGAAQGHLLGGCLCRCHLLLLRAGVEYHPAIAAAGGGGEAHADKVAN